ncbi:hypothetical protein [Micromonospora zhanjiangensis]|uniref:Uncharacterized protein n=1 Tax=Micromonospora zhanjiangensis TaxID=1522057 RepID=A0ABV8KK80_9ACTN
MTQNDGRNWRDEDRLPLSELERAMGAPAQDGQLDDMTGNDAGEEAAFGHGPEATDASRTASDEPGAGDGRHRDATDADRSFRPSTTGRTGPH